MPGTDFREVTRMVADLMPDLLAWPELPQRDSSSAIAGRTLGLLEQPCNLSSDGWRLAAARDAAQQRAARWWRLDLDDFEELTQDHRGVVKVALAGPWTLASSVRLAHPTMDHVIADAGACRDLAQALAEAIVELVRRLRRRLGRALIVQVDEPVIAAVLDGGLSTFSGLHRYRIPDREEVLASWRLLTAPLEQADGVEGVWLHSCAPGFDFDLARRAGFTGVSLDARYLDGPRSEACAEWLADGRTLGLGVVRTDRVEVPAVDQVVGASVQLLRRFGLDPASLDAQVVLTPACGLGGWPMREAGLVLERLAQASGLVAEQLRR